MRETFEEIVVRCDGMLSPAVYERIYQAARRGGLIVEVGTALGAGTVALALGLKDSHRGGRVYSFDPMAGGPRQSNLAGAERRIEHVRANLAHFGVDHLVELKASTLPDGIGILPPDEPVSVLMLDADGRIDRDLLVLEDRITAGMPIIIDDYADKVRVRRGSSSLLHVDGKMRLTYLLVNRLQETGHLNEGLVEGNTWFGEKLDMNGTRISLDDVLDVYRQMVFTKARHSRVDVYRRNAILTLERMNPNLLQRLRLWKRRKQIA